MDITSLLKKSGLSEKEIKVLTALLELGDSPVRDISSKAGVNRGTAYDILKSLVKQGLVSSFETKTNLHFAAEPPSKLLDYLEEKENNFKMGSYTLVVDFLAKDGRRAVLHINKGHDEWYFVEYPRIRKSYQCDQIDGLISFLISVINHNI
jgi:predicted DNA-binding transcriptional regulator